MSTKQVTIASKPVRSADAWVGGAIETVQKAVEEPVETKTAKNSKRLTLDIDEGLHKRIKRVAVEEGVTMVDMLRDLLRDTYK